MVCAHHCSSEVSASLHTSEIPGSSPGPKIFSFFPVRYMNVTPTYGFLISVWILGVAMVLILDGNM